jgi:hypothetical protein
MNTEFKKIKSTEEIRYVLETASAVATSSGAIATAPGKNRENSILAQEAGKEKEAPKPRNFVAKNAKMGGAGQHKDKKKEQKQGNEKHKKPFAEGFNGEYDDEAGMAHSNLLTSARAVIGLLKTIKDRDNLPEWGQEKIAKAEMMLVSVWDYLQSQKQMGNDPQQGVAEGLGKSIKRASQGWGVGAAPDMVTPSGAVSAFKNMDGQRLANFVASRKDQSKPRKNSAGAFVDKVIDREMRQRGYGRVANKDEQGVAEGFPIVVMPRADRLKKAELPKQRYMGDIVPPTKTPSTEKRGVKGRPGQRPMPDHSVAEGYEEDPLDLSSDYALYIANAGRKMMTQLTNLSKKIQADSTAAQNAKRWSLGDYMHQHYEIDDLNAINQVFEEYGLGGFFDQNLYKLLANWSSQGTEYITTWKQYSGDVIKNSTRKPGAQSVHEQDVAEASAQLDEISDTLRNKYVAQASNDYGYANFAARASKSHPGLEKYSKEQEQRAKKRASGLNRALSDKRIGKVDEDDIGTVPRRVPRKGARQERGHEPEPRYNYVKIGEQVNQVEAYGYAYNKRDQRVMWRKVFPTAEAAYAWAEKRNAIVLGTRELMDEFTDPELEKTLNYAQRHYSGYDKEGAYNKLIQRSMKHGEETDTEQGQEIRQLKRDVKNIRRKIGMNESRLYYNIVGTSEKKLRQDFNMSKDTNGWFLKENASSSDKLSALRAFGSPSTVDFMIEYDLSAFSGSTQAQGPDNVVSPVGSLPKTQQKKVKKNG